MIIGEFDLLIGASAGLNVLFFLVFQRLQTFWSTQGMPNFFTQQIKAAFNRIRNPKLVYGASTSRFAPVYIVGDNEPIFPDPTNKTGLPLQFDQTNLYRGPRGIPVVFAFQGSLQNTDPLKNANDDVELSLIAQTTEKFINIEVERRYQKDNPFNKIGKLLFIHGAIMVMGFIILAVILMNIQAIAEGVSGTIAHYQPIAENILKHPELYGIPTNIIGSNPTTPPPETGQLIPGVI